MQFNKLEFIREWGGMRDRGKIAKVIDAEPETLNI